ncbi:hypothetical protein CRV08_02030 [Halarcobacter ebronensis]|uniref:Uncharacterized protein n=1 Tax=Halarcobacter ebronensis TaxID=1462615 RepID=A0A4Q0YIA3_9BACT|nr:hypothetical protein [Halarcobacter ebronensis]RXJ69504.1 hypothetical protein CRV08_02030 [Halarcobacter ebronensis]
MKNTDKTQLILNEIKNMYPNKMILNASQVSKVLGISTRTFSRFIENEDWHKLPQFKSEACKRKDGTKYNKYQFNIFEIAEFLATN